MTERHKGRVYFVNDRVINICVVHAGVFQMTVESEISEEQYFSSARVCINTTTTPKYTGQQYRIAQ